MLVKLPDGKQDVEYCEECLNYTGQVKNVTEDTTLNELFCDKCKIELVEFILKNGLPKDKPLGVFGSEKDG